MNSYSIVALQASFYIFGGDTGPLKWNPIKTITVFSTITKEWKKIGELNVARTYHGVFVHRGGFVVTGGPFEYFQPNYPTEFCTLEGDIIQCKNVDPVLEHYYSYPEMMRVPADYCPK